MAEGLFHATGKRKTAVARVWMKPGTGEISINKRSLVQYLNRDADQNAVMEPLELTDLGEKFDFYINVRGGGIAGQAGAIRHGISRALVDTDPALRDPLKKSRIPDQRFQNERTEKIRTAGREGAFPVFKALTPSPYSRYQKRNLFQVPFFLRTDDVEKYQACGRIRWYPIPRVAAAEKRADHSGGNRGTPSADDSIACQAFGLRQN